MKGKGNHGLEWDFNAILTLVLWIVNSDNLGLGMSNLSGETISIDIYQVANYTLTEGV